MSWILWKKAIRDSIWLFLGCFVVLVLAQWLRVYFVSRLKLEHFIKIIDVFSNQSRFKAFEKLLPVPLDQIISNQGRISMGYSEPIILFVISIWSIARGSATVSGEIGRGTMEMVLAQPVRRVHLILTQVIVTTVESFFLALGTLMGTMIGLHYLLPNSGVELYYFFLASLNLLGFMLMVTSISTMVSAYDRYRYRTIGIVGAFFFIQKIIEMMSLLVNDLSWMKYFTIFTLFKPPLFVTDPTNALSLCLQYNGLYLVLAILCYVVAIRRFCNRDMPAPI